MQEVVSIGGSINNCLAPAFLRLPESYIALSHPTRPRAYMHVSSFMSFTPGLCCSKNGSFLTLGAARMRLFRPLFGYFSGRWDSSIIRMHTNLFRDQSRDFESTNCNIIFEKSRAFIRLSMVWFSWHGTFREQWRNDWWRGNCHYPAS